MPYFGFSSIQSLSRVRLFENPWITAHQASLSITNSRNLLKLMPIESVIPSSHLILCRPLFLLPSIFQHFGVACPKSYLFQPLKWSLQLKIPQSQAFDQGATVTGKLLAREVSWTFSLLYFSQFFCERWGRKSLVF